jgi:hypothetical protein
MRNVRTVVGIAAMLCTLGIGAASASASEFETFPAAKGTPKLTTKGVGVIKQEEFKVWPMTVVCFKAETKGTVPSNPGKFETFTEEVKFSTCSTFGGKVVVTVTPEIVEYNANGTETLTTPIKINPGGLACHYEIEPQTSIVPPPAMGLPLTFGDETNFSNPKAFPEGQLKLVLYTRLEGVKYEAVGWPCTGPKDNVELKGARKVEEKGEEGVLTAGVRDELNNGNLTWVK